MKRIIVVGGGPKSYIPDLKTFDCHQSFLIGADQGAEVLVEQGLTPDLAIGDFDSVTSSSLEEIKKKSREVHTFPDEKNETDLELAMNEALKRKPEHILLFGVTGGRMDHSQANMQLLYPLMKKGLKGTIIDQQNRVELASPGTHTLKMDVRYPYISFLPVTLEVTKITLKGFYYPLEEAYLPFGSTLCISNKLIEDTGTFSFESGILLVIRSTDLPQKG